MGRRETAGIAQAREVKSDTGNFQMRTVISIILMPSWQEDRLEGILGWIVQL
jgi:hypothetical protein